jgi:hypothetical protein
MRLDRRGNWSVRCPTFASSARNYSDPADRHPRSPSAQRCSRCCRASTRARVSSASQRWCVRLRKCDISAGVCRINEKQCPAAAAGSAPLPPPSLALGIMKSLAVGLTWPRIKFSSFQGCQSGVEFLPLIFPPPRPDAGKERAVGIS